MYNCMQTRLFLVVIFLSISSASLELPLPLDQLGSTLKTLVDKQSINNPVLSDYYDRGDAEIERIRKEVTRSVSRFYHNAESTVKGLLQTVPRSCDRLINEIPTRLPGKFRIQN